MIITYPNSKINTYKLSKSQIETIYTSYNHFKTAQVELISGEWTKRNTNWITNNPHKVKRVQINSDQFTNALIFDCDHEDIFEWQDFNLPAPSLTVKNKDNGKHHHIYFLAEPVPMIQFDKDYSYTAFNNYIKTNSFLEDIRRGMNKKLEADENYTNKITKNFLNENLYEAIKWDDAEQIKEYKLRDFAEFAQPLTKEDRKAIKKAKVNDDNAALGRNCTLFEEVRVKAYTAVKTANSDKAFEATVQKLANEVNSEFAKPLSDKEVMHTVKSISKWTWEHRDTIGDRYQKMSKDEAYKARSKRERSKTAKKIQKRRESIKKRMSFDEILQISGSVKDEITMNKCHNITFSHFIYNRNSTSGILPLGGVSEPLGDTNVTNKGIMNLLSLTFSSAP
jgi:hypothetical protein